MSLAGMAISLTVVAPCFKIKEQETRTAVVAVLTIVVFTFFYSIGAGPVPFTVSAEVFPLAYRGTDSIIPQYLLANRSQRSV